MYTKEHLIHEAVKVLKVSFYLIIILSIKMLINLGLMFVPTQTVTRDAQGNIKTITETTIGR